MGLQTPCPGGLRPACRHEMENTELPGRPPSSRSNGIVRRQQKLPINTGNRHNLSIGEGCLWLPLIDCVWLREKVAEQPRLTWD